MANTTGKKNNAKVQNKPVKGKSGGKGSASASASNENKKPNENRHDEVGGLILCAAGIILGVITYVPSDALFGRLVPILFGLVGIVAYALPVILLIAGIVIIAIPRKQIGTGLLSMLFGAIWSVMCIVHLAVSNVSGASTKFGDYIKLAYSIGVNRNGGGVIAALPAYGAARLITSVGAIVLFVTIAMILLLLMTRVSIRSAGKKVVEHIERQEDKRKAKLYNEMLDDDEEDDVEERLRRQRREERRQKRLHKHDKELIEPEADTAVKGLGATASPLGSSVAQGGTAAIDTLPTTGDIPKTKQKQDSELKSSFNISNAGLEQVNRPVHTTDYGDPFDNIEIVPSDNITGDTPNGEESSVVSEEQHFEAERKLSASDTPAGALDGEKPSGAAGAAEPAAEQSVPSASAVPPAVAIYQRPPISLLRPPDHSEAIAGESPAEKARLLIDTLASFNISARITNISVGPVITRFELQPAQGVRVNRITTLSNDIALALAAPRVRIEAPIPGKAAIGIEIPNKDTAMVRLREVVETRDFVAAKSPLTFALGKDIAGKPVMADLEKMPHMLIAGATGSGKSVCINGIILSLAYKSAPDDVRMILIDPKVVELSVFAPLPHLFCPVVTDPKKAAGALKWAVLEMEQRYAKMGKVNARDLARYNALQEKDEDKWPRLVIIIDELADLMMVASKDVEEAICRIAQLGRACGIHLIVATQRPSVDVITGLIKANIPSRIAFAVSNGIDSRVILDSYGAEKLLGRGDMLFHANGAAKPIRAQGAFVSDEEVEAVMAFFSENKVESAYDEAVISGIAGIGAPQGQGNGKQEDDLLPDAVRVVLESGSASISMIQRRLRVGYARAARLVDIMEQQKIVSGFDGSKPRKVLIDEAGYRRLFCDEGEGANDNE